MNSYAGSYLINADSHGLATPLVALAVAFLLGYALTAVARRVAPHLGMVDRPDGKRKHHDRPIPLMGGTAIYLAFAITMLLLMTFGPAPADGQRDGILGWLPLLASAILFCSLGLYDDRHALKPRWKLAGQVIACLPFVVWGGAIGKIGLLGLQCTLGMWSIPFTIFWLVACSNVINLIDGMDGLAGAISCIALLTLGAMATLMGRYDTAVVAIVAAAAVAGFLVHNWPPAKIFMGDSGSLMLGFLIGALGLQASLKQAAGFMLVVPLVLISVPVFDTAMAILRRKLSGRGIGEADHGHIHHRLQQQGLSCQRSLLLIAGLCFAMSGFCVLSFLVNSDLLALMLCCSLLAVLVVARIFGDYEIDLALQHARAIVRLLIDTSRVLPSRLLAIRLKNMGQERSEECWNMVCNQLAECGGTDLEMRFVSADGRKVLGRLQWASEKPAPAADMWQMTHTVRRERGILAVLTAHGVVTSSLWAVRWNEATQWIHALGSTWPLETLPIGGAHESGNLDADVIRFDPAMPLPDSASQEAEAAQDDSKTSRAA